MATVYLSLSAKKDIKGHNEVLIRFSHGRINQRAKTNIFIPPEYWNDETQQIDIPNFRVLTDEKKQLVNFLTSQFERLFELTATIQSLFNDADKGRLSPDWLKQVVDRFNFPEKYNPRSAEPEFKTLLQYVDNFILTAPLRKDKKTGRLLTENNTKQYRTTARHLREYAKYKKKVDFEFSEIDKKFYDDFVSYLQGKNFTQNSVGKYIRALKVMLNDATTKGVNENNAFKEYYVFNEDVDSIYLNEKELQQIKDVDFSTMPHYDRVRDWFLLLCWTGCRYSDLHKVITNDVKDGFLSFHQQKTGDKVIIPLHPVVMEVLDKYNNNMPKPITNQKFNDAIKEICCHAGITGTESITRTKGGELTTEKFKKCDLVSSHTGRRSFCTNMYKRGLPTLMIMSMSGHRTEKSFLKYIKVTQKEHAELMKKAWENMYKNQ